MIILGQKSVDRNESFIDINKGKLFIKGVKFLPLELQYGYTFKYATFIDTDGKSFYVGFNENKISAYSRRVVRSDYGYYTIDVSDMLHQLNITQSCNVNVMDTSKDGVFILNIRVKE